MKLLSTFPGKTHSLSFTFQLKTLLFLPETFIPYVKIYKTKYGKQLKRILDKRRLPVKRCNFFF